MKNQRNLLLALVAIVSLAACSRPGIQAPTSSSVASPVAEAGAVEACKLLTKEIAESVVGPINKPPSTDGSRGSMSNCMYLADDFSAVSLLVTSGFGNATFDQAFQASKSISGVDPVKVGGLGDMAYWAGGTLNQMNILKGGNLMIIMALGVKGDLQTVSKGVAEKVLANM